MPYHVTTPSTLPASERNAAVVRGNIRCQSIDCKERATRWTNLCGKCERQYLEDMRPVFGKPTNDQLAVAQAVIREHYAQQLVSGVFADWSSQIGRTFSRPVSSLPAPLRMKSHRKPRQRFNALLALRTRDRGALTKRGVINLLAFCLVIDALITRTIPQPVRREYMLALLGQRFMRREVYSRTVMRYRTRREKTGVIRYGPNGPVELTRMIEEEVPTKEYCRIRRADLRYLGRQLWKTMEATLLSGGRQGVEWRTLQDQLNQRLFQAP